MSLREQINQDMKEAMKARQTERLNTLRLLLAAMKQIEVDQRITLDDAGVIQIIQKMCKQRKDSIEQFRLGKREDLAEIENNELMLLQTYLPQQLSEEDIKQVIKSAITTTGASTAADIGKVMAILKPQLAGKADMAIVSKLLKAEL